MANQDPYEWLRRMQPVPQLTPPGQTVLQGGQPDYGVQLSPLEQGLSNAANIRDLMASPNPYDNLMRVIVENQQIADQQQMQDLQTQMMQQRVRQTEQDLNIKPEKPIANKRLAAYFKYMEPKQDEDKNIILPDQAQQTRIMGILGYKSMDELNAEMAKEGLVGQQQAGSQEAQAQPKEPALHAALDGALNTPDFLSRVTVAQDTIARSKGLSDEQKKAKYAYLADQTQLFLDAHKKQAEEIQQRAQQLQKDVKRTAGADRSGVLAGPTPVTAPNGPQSVYAPPEDRSRLNFAGGRAIEPAGPPPPTDISSIVAKLKQLPLTHQQKLDEINKTNAWDKKTKEQARQLLGAY